MRLKKFLLSPWSFLLIIGVFALSYFLQKKGIVSPIIGQFNTVDLSYFLVAVIAIYIAFIKSKNNKNSHPTKDADFLSSKGFVKCTDPKVTKMIEEIFKREVAFGVRTTIEEIDLPQYQIEVSGSNSPLFNYELHPTVDGYQFYRGYAFKLGSGIVMIFTGWTHPQEPHVPLVYTKGNFFPEVIQNVVDAFFQKVAYKIGKGFVNNFFPVVNK